MKKLILAAVLVVFGVAITAPDVSAHGGRADISQENGLLYVSTPFFFPDGDVYPTYLEPLSSGGFRVTDMGSTLMSLSYENDISKLREGTRVKAFEQAITRAHNITFLNRVRVESTFYEDPESVIKEVRGEVGFVRDYADMTALPRADIARLTNAANGQIATLHDLDTLKRKIAAGMG